MSESRDNRRQSGLWAQNQDGYFEQQPPASSNAAPYQYYQPPTKHASDGKRTFLDRAAGVTTPETDPRPSQQNGQPANVSHGVSRSESKRRREQVIAPGQKLDQLPQLSHRYPDLTSEQLSGTQHVNSTRLPGSSKQPPLRDLDTSVPDNVRSKPWSPSPISPTTGSQNVNRHASNASEHLRRGSVPDRSPLQKLEVKLDDISKEEKRARMEEAEYRAKQKSQGRIVMPAEGDILRSGTLRSEKGRVVSDGSRRLKESQAPAISGESGASKFRRASDALRQEVEPGRSLSQQEPARTSERRREETLPRRHEPEAVREPAQRRTSTGEKTRYYAQDLTKSESRKETTRDRAVSAEQPGNSPTTGRTSDSLDRTASGKYKHRARDAGFAGAAAAVGASAAERGRLAHERRKSQMQSSPANSPTTPSSGDRGFGRSGTGSVGRSNSKRLQKRAGPPDERHGKGSPKFRGLTDDNLQNQGPSFEGQDHIPKSRENRTRDARGPAEFDGKDERRSVDRRDFGDNTRDDRVQKPSEPQAYQTGTRGTAGLPSGQQQLQTDRMGGGHKKEKQAAEMFQEPDIIPPKAVKTAPNDPLSYSVPPQTAAGREAKELVGFGTAAPLAAAAASGGGSREKDHHRFKDMFHRHKDEPRSYQAGATGVEEWRTAKTALLTVDDLDIDTDAPASATSKDPNAPWWDKKDRRTSGGPGSRHGSAQYDGAYEEEAQSFRPPLFLKCGPLLRYTGMRREAASSSRNARGTSAAPHGEREVWRGSVMIVTEDVSSDYSSVPTLRLFAQPADLFTPPPQHLLDSGQELPPEYEDPVAGQVKLSRTGRPLYVRPVHDIEGGIDLSMEENNQGLYAATRTPMLGPQSVSGPDGRTSQHITFQDKSRIKRRDGEKAGKYREVKAARLHTERGLTFWRFNLEIELGTHQHRVAYRINRGPALGFWVPARGETMNIMFHSCNGFSLSVDPDLFSGPDPLWRDVLNRHQARPFHVMLGGGDQIYNDRAMRDTELFREWLQTKNPEHKHKAEFTSEMQDELETFYLDRYAMWFSQGLFAMANSQIPMVNVWDDHDIIDGFGSYPHHFMSTRVFTGLGAVAFKYYMLFQHQSVVGEGTKEEPSWLLGASPGPYINELSRSIFMHLGRKVAFLGLDCRTERMRDEILSQESYDAIFDRCRAEIVQGETKHLIVLLGVPIAYPRLNFLENILTSKMMDPIKALGRTGMLGGFVNKFDGGVEILDDLDDHWTAKHHKAERNWFVQELQELAAEKSVRVTILGGDVHLGAVGQFYSNKKLGIPKDRDHRYMPNVVSSAIVNTPPPVMMGDILNKRNKVHHLDEETDEDMIPMFNEDVDGSKRNNLHLLPRRNFCTIKEYLPGSTPPPSPGPEAQTPIGEYDERDGRDRRYPPGSMKRTMSLTRSGSGRFRPGNVVRRLSWSRSSNPPVSLAPEHARPYSAHSQQTGAMQRSQSLQGSQDGGSYFPQQGQQSEPRPGGLFRRPTTMSVKEARKAAAKGGADGNLDGREAGHIDLEGGLDISLCMEIDQKDPAGGTVPYRLLVPALWFEGQGDENTARFKGRGATLMDRFRGKGQGRKEMGDYSRSPSRSDGSRTPSPPPGRGYAMAQPQRLRDRGELADLQATAAGAGAGRGPQKTSAHGYDGAYDNPDMNAGRGPQRTSAQGYDGASDNRDMNNGRGAQRAGSQGYDGGYEDRDMDAGISRKPTLMQRLRGSFRGKKGMDDYSRSPTPSDGSRTPSPPPGRGMAMAQPQRARDKGELTDLQATAAGAGRRPQKPNAQGYDGAYDDHNTSNGVSRPNQPLSDPYNKGYNLNSPPIGSTQQTSANNNPYPQSGYRRTSAPVSNKHSQNTGYGAGGSYTESDGSLTPSEQYDEPGANGNGPRYRERRPSKAERFFGIGDEDGTVGQGGRRASMDQYGDEGGMEGVKKKPNWKIWK